MTEPHYNNPDPYAPPGLHAIAVMEAGKGLLALFAASGLELLGPAPLKRWLQELITHFRVDPNHGAIATLSQALNPDAVHIAAAVVFAYALLRLVEAWGLWRDQAWASWLGFLGSAVYLPFDLYALATHPGWLAVAVLVINLVVVWVLGRHLIKRRG